MRSVPWLALEAIAIEQGQKQMEILILAIMRRGGEQQKLASAARKRFPQLESLRALNLGSVIGRGHLVRFIHNYQIPIHRADFGLHILIPAELIQTSDAQV